MRYCTAGPDSRGSRTSVADAEFRQRGSIEPAVANRWKHPLPVPARIQGYSPQRSIPAGVIAITSAPSPLDYVLRHFSGRGDRKVETPMQLGLTAARVRALIAAGGFALLALTTVRAQANTPYLERPEVLTFMSDLQAQYGFDIAELERVLGDARYEPRVVRLIGPERPTTAAPVVRSWPGYRARFLTRARIHAGVQYWQLHEDDLRRAQAEFGVPAEVILGILGVETAFGRNTGSFRTVDALATIAFDGPRRQEYFRDELKELLLLSREMKVDPLALRGSYAGAIGLPQFMPSSYRKYAVDYDGDGAIDLLGEASDLRAVAREQRDGVPAVREAPGQRGTVAWSRSSHDGHGFAFLHRELLPRLFDGQPLSSANRNCGK